MQSSVRKLRQRAKFQHYARFKVWQLTLHYAQGSTLRHCASFKLSQTTLHMGCISHRKVQPPQSARLRTLSRNQAGSLDKLCTFWYSRSLYALQSCNLQKFRNLGLTEPFSMCRLGTVDSANVSTFSKGATPCTLH